MKHTRLRLLLLYPLITIRCGPNLFNTLQGAAYWVDKATIEHESVDGITNTEPPDFIFLHKSGRYFVFNDSGGMHPSFPMIDRGNWSVNNKNQIIFISDFDGKPLVEDGKQFLQYNKRIPMEATRMEVFTDGYTVAFRLSTNSRKEGKILTLKYNLLYPGEKKSFAKVTMEDQEGHQLWEKTLLFTHQKQTEEILLADIVAGRPAMFEQDEIRFKVHCQFSWELKVKLYD